ncbi:MULTISPECIES: response regulator transcription factor [unclassified Sporosarcina]|nr:MULTISPECIES: response regulator transcription factor [unclassified Sporosarcina]
MKGLDKSADDYIVKPFDARELIAKVNAILRRSEKLEEDLDHPDCGE